MYVEGVIEYLIVNIFYIYIVSRFLTLFFKTQQQGKKMRLLMYIIFYGTNSAVNLTLHNPVCNVLTNIAGIFLVTCFYRAHWLKRVSATLMIYVLCMATDMLVYAVIGSYAPNKDIGITLNIISYLLIFTVEVVLEKIVELKENQYI
jgi:hypothetical protein